jgi:hypothetical protein
MLILSDLVLYRVRLFFENILTLVDTSQNII